MKPRLASVAVWIAALWWGSLTTVGFGVVPLLFANLATPAMAGTMAAKLFSAQTWVAVVCGLFLLLNLRSNQTQGEVAQARPALIFIVAGIFLALLSEYAIAPHIVARENLPLWHSLGSVMYVAQWLCAGMTFRKLMAGRSS